MSKSTPKSKKVPIFIILVPLYAGLAVIFILLIRRGSLQLLEPAGYIATVQSQILWATIIFAAVMGSMIVGLFFFVVSRYKEGGKARYQPEWSPGILFNALAWFIPIVAISALSIMVWDTAHQIDPYQPIRSSVAPITIQVVALQWKWLFLYPSDKIASVNTIEIPVHTPIAFQLTADAPMNSFWIPRLSGQVFAMNGMVTQLHIEADSEGVYFGSPAELSGDGFAGMNFTVRAVSTAEYTN